MAETLEPDLCVIGAGSGGLSVAAGAVQMGARVVLIEGGRMGGDCLNYGCVPSKSLIAAAKRAAIHRGSTGFGVAGHEPRVDYAAVMRHVHETVAAIAPHDSVERFEGLGVTVIRDWARFVSPREIRAGATVIRPRRVVLATGSAPVVPPIPGLQDLPYLTNETLWDLDVLPERLLIVGAGPIGLEMAQAYRRLGSAVTVIEAAAALGAEDPEIAAVAIERVRAEGVEIIVGAEINAAGGQSGDICLRIAGGQSRHGSHLLIAAGRRPVLDGLDLEAGGVAHDSAGVRVDRGLRSISNRRVYAIGDVAGRQQFTHVAGWHAGLIVRNALFRLPVNAANTLHVPRVTFTDPQIAHIGLTEAEARAAEGDAVEIHRLPYASNDRARAERATEGLVKLIAGRRGRILGVSIVGAEAGEVIQPWALALSARLRLKQMAGYISPYPTLGELSKRVAGAYYAPRLFQSVWVKRIVRLLARLG